MGNCPSRQCVVQRKKKNFLLLSAVRVTPPTTLWASFCQTFLSRLSLSFHFLLAPLTVVGVCKPSSLTHPAIPRQVQKSASTHDHLSPVQTMGATHVARAESTEEKGCGGGATSLARPRANISIHTSACTQSVVVAMTAALVPACFHSRARGESSLASVPALFSCYFRVSARLHTPAASLAPR